MISNDSNKAATRFFIWKTDLFNDGAMYYNLAKVAIVLQLVVAVGVWMLMLTPTERFVVANYPWAMPCASFGIDKALGWFVPAWSAWLSYVAVNGQHLPIIKFVAEAVPFWDSALATFPRVFHWSWYSWLILPATGIYFALDANKANRPQWLRGARVVEAADIKRMQRDRGDTNHMYQFYGLQISRQAMIGNTLVVGATRMGKTTGKYLLMEDIRRYDEKAVIHDVKLEDYATWGRGGYDHLMNLMDKRGIGSCPELGWTISNEFVELKDIISTGYSIIEAGQGQARYWNGASRNFFCGVAQGLWYQGDCSNKRLAQMLAAPKKEVMALAEYTIKEAERRGDPDCGAAQLLAYCGDDKLLANIRSVCLAYVLFLGFQIDGPFSVTKWVRDESDKSNLFIANNEDLKDILTAPNSLVFDLLAKRIIGMGPSKARTIHFLMDEFTSLNQCSALVNISRVGAGCGAFLHLLFQTIAGCEEKYGKNNTEELLNNMASWVTYKQNSNQMAEYLSLNIGDGEFRTNQSNKTVKRGESQDGRTVSEIDATKRVVMASEITGMEPYRTYVKVSGYPWAGAKPPYKEFPQRNELYVPREGLSTAAMMQIQRAAEQAKAEAERVVACEPVPEILKAEFDQPREENGRPSSLMEQSAFSKLLTPAVPNTVTLDL